MVRFFLLFCPSLFSSIELAIQQHIIPGVDDPVAVHIQQLLIAVAAGLGIQAVQEGVSTPQPPVQEMVATPSVLKAVTA